MNMDHEHGAGLPIRRGLAPVYASSLAVALLMAVASIAGLAYSAVIYPTDELLRTFVANDVASLLLGMPILLGSMGLARRGRMMGLLCWPGALLFVLYNYLAYVFALPLGLASLLHLALVVLSAYGLLALVAVIDAESVKRSLAGLVPERIGGAVLAGLGLLFFLRALVVLLGAVTSGTAVARTELAVNVSDSLISPIWVIGGALLWRRRSLGYVLGLGLLLGISLLFVALVVLMFVQPLLTAAPVAFVDAIVILGMGLICFIPCSLFARGVASSHPRPVA